MSPQKVLLHAVGALGAAIGAFFVSATLGTVLVILIRVVAHAKLPQHATWGIFWGIFGASWIFIKLKAFPVKS